MQQFRNLTFILPFLLINFCWIQFSDNSLYENDTKPAFTGGCSKDQNINELMLWPNATVYYKFHSNMGSNRHLTTLIRSAMSYIQNKSCVNFIETNTSINYILISNFEEIMDTPIGYKGGEQGLNFKPSQVNGKFFGIGHVQHKLFHALGFHHQQNAKNRDEYVRIFEDNIQSHAKIYFEKNNIDEMNYDYGSIMHSAPCAYSVKRNVTIIPVKKNNTDARKMGQRVNITIADAQKLRQMYGCDCHLEP